jgi:hypothetical protein
MSESTFAGLNHTLVMSNPPHSFFILFYFILFFKILHLYPRSIEHRSRRDPATDTAIRYFVSGSWH